jgi:hypothetical protein
MENGSPAALQACPSAAFSTPPRSPPLLDCKKRFSGGQAASSPTTAPELNREVGGPAEGAGGLCGPAVALCGPAASVGLLPPLWACCCPLPSVR